MVRGEWGGSFPQLHILRACEAPGDGFEVCAQVVFHHWVVLETACLPVCPRGSEINRGPRADLEVRWLPRDRYEEMSQPGKEQQQPEKPAAA